MPSHSVKHHCPYGSYEAPTNLAQPDPDSGTGK